MARTQQFETGEALRQALAVFWRKGYEATSLTDLMRETGLSKSSLYGVFGSKRELFLAAFDAYRAMRGSDIAAMLASGTARQGIEAFFRSIVTDATVEGFHCGCMSVNQAVEMAPRDGDIRRRVAQDFAGLQGALADSIARGQSEGSITSRRDPQALARLLVLSFPGLQVMARAGSSAADLDAYLEALLSNLD